MKKFIKAFLLLLLSTIFLMPIIILRILLPDSNYPVNQFTIQNNLNELYTIKYQEYDSFPDQQITLKIFKDTTLILESHSDYKPAYIPQNIVHLFQHNNSDYYFMSTKGELEYILINEKNKTKEVLIPKKTKYFESKEYDIYINNVEKYTTISNILQKNITEQELKKIFTDCGYDYTYILKLYHNTFTDTTDSTTGIFDIYTKGKNN